MGGERQPAAGGHGVGELQLDGVVVLGGGVLTSIPNDIVRFLPQVDIGVVGEGFLTWPEILDRVDHHFLEFSSGCIVLQADKSAGVLTHIGKLPVDLDPGIRDHLCELRIGVILHDNILQEGRERSHRSLRPGDGPDQRQWKKKQAGCPDKLPGGAVKTFEQDSSDVNSQKHDQSLTGPMVQAPVPLTAGPAPFLRGQLQQHPLPAAPPSPTPVGEPPLIDVPAPPAPAAVEFLYAQSESFVALLRQLGASLLVSTYQANKLLAVRAVPGGLSTLVRTFDRPMGIAADARRLALGTHSEVWLMRNAPDIAPRIEPAGRRFASELGDEGSTGTQVRRLLGLRITPFRPMKTPLPIVIPLLSVPLASRQHKSSITTLSPIPRFGRRNRRFLRMSAAFS